MGVILCTLVILEFVQVAMRYIFDQGLFWAADVTLLLLLSLGWLGAAHLWFIKQHLTLRLFDRWLMPYQQALDGLVDLLAVLGALYLIPGFIDTLKIYAKIELAVLPVSAAVIYIPPLVSITLIGISGFIKLSACVNPSAVVKFLTNSRSSK